MKHHEWMIITGFRLHFAPISESPDKILDLGTGTGKLAPLMKIGVSSGQLACRYLGNPNGYEFYPPTNAVRHPLLPKLRQLAEKYPKAEVIGIGMHMRQAVSIAQ